MVIETGKRSLAAVLVDIVGVPVVFAVIAVVVVVIVLLLIGPNPAAVIEADFNCISILSQLCMRKSILVGSVTRGNRVSLVLSYE